MLQWGSDRLMSPSPPGQAGCDGSQLGSDLSLESKVEKAWLGLSQEMAPIPPVLRLLNITKHH